MDLLQSLDLLPDLKLIIFDYMGKNKYQLNYKKCIEEYKKYYYNEDNYCINKYVGHYTYRYVQYSCPLNVLKYIMIKKED